MKNSIKATKMQLAKKHPVKARISNMQTKKESREIEQLSNRMKHPMRDHGSQARAAKEVSFYIGIDLGDKKSNYCFLDAICKTIHQLPNLGDCENATGGETRYRHEDSSPTFYGSQTAPSPKRLTKSADGSKANRWWRKRLYIPGLNGLKHGFTK
jgi:hypothetical protein